MRLFVSFMLLFLSMLSLLVMIIIGNLPNWTYFIPLAVGLFSTILIFRGIYLPQKAVEHGMELIKSQDYNNRLAKIGEPNADRIVLLFNSLIDKLRAERLQNREQESLLKLLVEASPMGVVMLDFNNLISMVNFSFLKMIGYKNSLDILGKKIDEIEHGLINEIIKVPLGKSEIMRKGDFLIYRIYHLNFVQKGFRRDFFLLETLTEEIVKAERSAYEKVIRIISHEVNNTMGGVRSVLETIRESCEEEDLRKVVESCERRCDGLGNFIREYADVVKLPEPSFKRMDLQKEINLMLPFFHRISPENVTIIHHLKDDVFLIKGDSSMLQQAILNIVKNAVESIQEEGFIELGITKSQNNVVLTVSNNGEPIDEKISGDLFTPFFTTKPNGKGIGLTLIKEILTRHSAEYSLATGPDGITRFVITFPCYSKSQTES